MAIYPEIKGVILIIMIDIKVYVSTSSFETVDDEIVWHENEFLSNSH